MDGWDKNRFKDCLQQSKIIQKLYLGAVDAQNLCRFNHVKFDFYAWK